MWSGVPCQGKTVQLEKRYFRENCLRNLPLFCPKRADHEIGAQITNTSSPIKQNPSKSTWTVFCFARHWCILMYYFYERFQPWSGQKEQVSFFKLNCLQKSNLKVWPSSIFIEKLLFYKETIIVQTSSWRKTYRRPNLPDELQEKFYEVAYPQMEAGYAKKSILKKVILVPFALITAVLCSKVTQSNGVERSSPSRQEMKLESAKINVSITLCHLVQSLKECVFGGIFIIIILMNLKRLFFAVPFWRLYPLLVIFFSEEYYDCNYYDLNSSLFSNHSVCKNV